MAANISYKLETNTFCCCIAVEVPNVHYTLTQVQLDSHICNCTSSFRPTVTARDIPIRCSLWHHSDSFRRFPSTSTCCYISIIFLSTPQSTRFLRREWKKVGSNNKYGPRDSAVGWGNALQVGRSWVRFPMVSMEFFIGIVVPPALWPWGQLSL
jgi:hypothetical protein